MKLKVKEEYEGLIITKNVFLFGEVTFDYYKVKPEYYKFYNENGFDVIFEEVKEQLPLDYEPTIVNNIEYEATLPKREHLETKQLKELRKLYPNIKANTIQKFLDILYT